MTGTASQIITRLLRYVHEDPEKLFDLSEHKNKRSLQANAYFHRLIGLLANSNGDRFYEIKNEMITQYGNHELIRDEAGKPVYEILPDDDRWKRNIMEHYLPTEYTDDFRGLRMRAFLKLKGTHTYNTKEMYNLIQGVRNECIGCDIPMDEIETYEERRLYLALQNKAEQSNRH